MKKIFLLYFLSELLPIFSKEIVIFNLDKKKMLIKDIKILYNGIYYKKINLILDTMSFITKLKINKLNFEIYNESEIIYSANSYRSFSGRKSFITFINNNIKNKFPISIFSMFHLREKKFYLNLNEINYDGFIGLALNYSNDIAVQETFFFGYDKEYSIMNYLKENNIINKNIFSINDNYFILGKLNLSNDIYYCNCDDKLEFSYKYFFWNCWSKGIKIENEFLEVNNVFIFDSLVIGIIFPETILLKIIELINNYLGEKICFFEKELLCLSNFVFQKISNLSIQLKEGFDISFKLKDLFYYSLRNNNGIYKSIISSSKESSTIIIGKIIFDYYFIEFDEENKKIGFSNFLNLNNLSEKYFYEGYNLFINKKIILFIILFLILILFIGILINLYIENSVM